MSVYTKITQEIDALGVRPIAPGMAAAAEALAEAMDDNEGATGRANAASQLRMIMNDLYERAPVQSQGDTLDELTQRRKERHAG